MSTRKKKQSKEELEKIAEFCENPKSYGWDICDDPAKFGIDPIAGPMSPLFEYQDKCIEHQDAEVPIVSHYTEAVGDIFREVSKMQKSYIAGEYIDQKLNRLRDLARSWNMMDEKDKQFLITEDKKQVLRAYEQKVNKFHQLASVNCLKCLVPQCKGYEDVRAIQDSSAQMLKHLIKWGLEEKTINEVQFDLYMYIRAVESFLEQRSSKKQEG
jgi:hypothetical protein